MKLRPLIAVVLTVSGLMLPALVTAQEGGSGIPATLPPAPENSTLSTAQTEALPILLAARADLEIIAAQAVGSANRPSGWNGSVDTNDPNLPLNIRLDLELLASSRWGDDRPPGWFGVIDSVPLAIARDIRHDLELLADDVMGVSTLRPAGWRGDDPIYRCSRSTQALLLRLEADGIEIAIDPAQADYCRNAEIDASLQIERTIMQPISAGAGQTSSSSSYPYIVDSPYGVAFADRNARRIVGVLPVGTGFSPLGRSMVGFSNMTLIEGVDFRIYVDWTTTPLTLEMFNSLTDFDTLGGEIYCDAEWCTG